VFVTPGSLCFDIGANIGRRTGIFLALGARVLAVEPQPHCVDEIRAMYHTDRLFIVEKGIAAQEGTAILHLSPQLHTVASMSGDWIESIRTKRLHGWEWNQAIEVPTTTLDRLIDQYGLPDFCKIDVEGFEEEVLRGLTRPIRTLSFEYNPEFINPAIACIRKLEQVGDYEFNHSLDEVMVLSTLDWRAGSEMVNRLQDPSLLDERDGQRRRAGLYGDVYARLRE